MLHILVKITNVDVLTVLETSITGPPKCIVVFGPVDLLSSVFPIIEADLVPN